jgi:hypothetical protein
MRKFAKKGIVCAGVLAIGACQTTPTPLPYSTAPTEAADVRQAMVEGVNPAALTIWEVANAASADDGTVSPAKLDAITLARLHEAAQVLATYARLITEAPVIHASGPDLVGDEVPEGVATREQIQMAINASPDGFRAYSRAMGAEAEDILGAVAAGDRQRVADRIVAFDGACQGCHKRYWYVNQQ